MLAEASTYRRAGIARVLAQALLALTRGGALADEDSPGAAGADRGHSNGVEVRDVLGALPLLNQGNANRAEGQGAYGHVRNYPIP